MDEVCKRNFSKLRIELEDQIVKLEFASYSLDLEKVLSLSEGIKNRCKKQAKSVLPIVQIIEKLKSEINIETQNRLRKIISLIDAQST